MLSNGAITLGVCVLKPHMYFNVFVSLRCTDVYLCLQEMTQIFQLHLRSVFPLLCSISVVIWLPICLPVYRVSCFHTVLMWLLPVASCFASFSTVIPWQNSHIGCRTGLTRFFLTLLFFPFDTMHCTVCRTFPCEKSWVSHSYLSSLSLHPLLGAPHPALHTHKHTHSFAGVCVCCELIKLQFMQCNLPSYACCSSVVCLAELMVLAGSKESYAWMRGVQCDQDYSHLFIRNWCLLIFLFDKKTHFIHTT